eukprot:jgi/Botrbrau1/21966/Bobra.0249s0089.1
MWTGTNNYSFIMQYCHGPCLVLASKAVAGVKCSAARLEEGVPPEESVFVVNEEHVYTSCSGVARTIYVLHTVHSTNPVV